MIQAIKSDPELSSLYDKDMEDYFNMFMKAIMKGEFEELSNDVCMFLPCGHDLHGFQLYFRMRGTVQTENLHSKMNNAIGPWGISARTAHMLLVLICYRCNINTDLSYSLYQVFYHEDSASFVSVLGILHVPTNFY